MQTLQQQRQHFAPLLQAAYLDHPTTGMIPGYACEAMCNYLTHRAEAGMTIAEFWGSWNEADALRDEIGRMIGCSGREVVYGQSSTALYNLFANGIDLGPGDNVVMPDTTYPANAYIWDNKRAGGVEVRVVPSHEGVVNTEDILAQVDDRTKAVALCLVENKTGFKYEVEPIGAFCRARGIPLVVDATQAVGALKINVKAMKIDFLTTSGYKWLLSPLGIGFAYISDALLKTLGQSVVGWVGTVDRTHNDPLKLSLSADAKRYETGGISMVALQGLSEVIRRYNALGADVIEAHIAGLVNHVYARAEALTMFRIYGNYAEANRSPIVVWAMPDGQAVTDAMLEAFGVRCRCFAADGIIRTGFHYMNNLSEADRLVDALLAIEKQL